MAYDQSSLNDFGRAHHRVEAADRLLGDAVERLGGGRVGRGDRDRLAAVAARRDRRIEREDVPRSGTLNRSAALAPAPFRKMSVVSPHLGQVKPAMFSTTPATGTLTCSNISHRFQHVEQAPHPGAWSQPPRR